MTHYLNYLNLNYIEDLLQAYRQDPNSIDQTWRYFFDGLSLGGDSQQFSSHPAAVEALDFEIKVLELIQGYRDMAYLIADVNPLDRSPKTHPLLELKNFRLTEADLSKPTKMGSLLGLKDVTLQKLIDTLRSYYCTTLAVETSHIEDPKTRNWVHEQVEKANLISSVAPEHRKQALNKLCEAENFEQFIHKKFVGQKRFSVEGCDALIPMVDFMIDRAASLGADEVIIAMAHRGRLNVLANLFQKDLRKIFAEFSGNLDMDLEQSQGDGDVKYHMGYSSDTHTFSGHDVHMSLAPNPSHLEAINSVAMGMTRSKQRTKKDTQKNKTILILLHGDASFSGQGSVYEVLNMSELEAYSIGGTIHVIVNNQIGFTTDPVDGRSTKNPTDVCKMLQIPIFRVNADEPDAVLAVSDLAVRYRHAFHRDVIIDLVGYRRFGHNEGDEPTFTQPLVYDYISAHPTVYQIYSQKLIQEKIVTPQEVETFESQLLQNYEKALEEARAAKFSPKMDSFGKKWQGFSEVPQDDKIFVPVQTGVAVSKLKELSSQLLLVPQEFHLHKKIQRLREDHLAMMNGSKEIDWGWAEALAFGSLLQEGYDVRLVGQDAKRGTFSHRHAVFFDVENGKQYAPLHHLSGAQGNFQIFNSFLSEMAAMGFEFGCSLANPNKLTLWEAQFGDFVNGAQIIIDQFLTCSAFKWQRHSGLVLLLPHGYEGQGPEHSSGRLERFLQACAQNNIQVCNLTTPAQYFHVLRRQMSRKYKLPLVIMTPKSLLRSPQAVSSWESFDAETFHEVINEHDAAIQKQAKRVIFCSGKIYYELLKHRQDIKSQDVALVRVEQFYPFPEAQYKAILKSYKNAEQFVWCQEEPQNMGGWWFMSQYLRPLIPQEKLIYIGRKAYASPAHGYMNLHKIEQNRIVTEALEKL